MKTKIKKIYCELKHHIPFTATATVIALFTTFFIFYILKKEIPKESFHFFHFSHIVFSAMATAGVFYKYKKKIISTIFVGSLGAIIIGSFSDVIFPYVGSLILGINASLHLPLIEETALVLFFSLMGGFLGMFIRETRFSHFIHVFLSVFASLFYILSFTTTLSLLIFVGISFVVFLAVIIPCCLSDIVFPLLFVYQKDNNKKC